MGKETQPNQTQRARACWQATQSGGAAARILHERRAGLGRTRTAAWQGGRGHTRRRLVLKFAPWLARAPLPFLFGKAPYGAAHDSYRKVRNRRAGVCGRLGGVARG